MNNTLVLGDGYIGSAFRDAGMPCIGKKHFFYNGDNFNTIVEHIKKYDVIINAMAMTDTRKSELPENFKDLWNVNVELVKNLSKTLSILGKKLVHLSTGDLYGNNFDVKDNVETSTKIDVGTKYRLSKYVAEQFCHPTDLILRIRLPFDGRKHPKNLLTKVEKFTKFYSYVNDYTYVPDLVEATLTLIKMNQTGIFNVVSHEDGCILYLLRNILELPHLQSYDLHTMDHPNIIRELDNLNVHNVSNDEKLRGYFIQTPLDVAIKKSWKELHNL